MHRTSPSNVIVGIVALVFMCLVHRCAVAGACEDLDLVGHYPKSPIVSQLASLVASHIKLAKAFESGFNAQPSESYWHAKSISSMYPLFDAWLSFNPMVDNYRKHVDCFVLFYSQNHKPILEALDAIRDSDFIAWMEDFIKARGAYLDSMASSSMLEGWLKHTPVNIGQFEVPDNGYASFNAFFTRKLKAGARPIFEPLTPSTMIAPGDCDLSELSVSLTERTSLAVKDEEHYLSKLLDDADLANEFYGGRALLCFLNVENYHRFHSPVPGRIVFRKQIGGFYLGSRGFVDHFFERRRGVYVIKVPSYGLVGVVAVGIADISSVNLTRQEGETVRKGDEIGFFAYGGSALLLLFQKGQLTSLITKEKTGNLVLDSARVNMGQWVGNMTYTSGK